MPPAIAYGGAFLFLVAAFLIAWGLLTVYRLSLKPLLLGIASLFFFSLGAGPVHLGQPLARIGNALVSLANKIDDALAEAVIASEHGIVWLWHALAKQAEWLGRLLGDLAETIEGKFRVWYLAFPPLAAIWAAVKAAQQLPELWRAIHAAKGSVVNITERVYKQGAQVTNVTRNYITKVVAAGVAATAGAVALPAPWIRTRLHELDGKVSALAKLLTPAAVVALIGATIFKTFRLGWLRCPGVNRVGRSLCGLSPLIEALYAGAITAFAVTDLCRFAYGIEKAAETIRPLMLEFVDVENALFGCSSASYPHDFPLAAFSPTPVIDAVAL